MTFQKLTNSYTLGLVLSLVKVLITCAFAYFVFYSLAQLTLIAMENNRALQYLVQASDDKCA